jgi:hypothetical protein
MPASNKTFTHPPAVPEGTLVNRFRFAADPRKAVSR